jgi:hypothetical protein
MMLPQELLSFLVVFVRLFDWCTTMKYWMILGNESCYKLMNHKNAFIFTPFISLPVLPLRKLFGQRKKISLLEFIVMVVRVSVIFTFFGFTTSQIYMNNVQKSKQQLNYWESNSIFHERKILQYTFFHDSVLILSSLKLFCSLEQVFPFSHLLYFFWQKNTDKKENTDFYDNKI